jgi:ketosteroid isomerase-like protein
MPVNAEKEILALENKYWTSIRENDMATVDRLTDDPCIVTGPQGASRIDKATFKKMMAKPTWTLLDYEIKNAEVGQPSADVAIIGYNVHVVARYEGKEVTLDAADASTWVKKNGSWVCALHTEAPLGDPFGRDHQRPN